MESTSSGSQASDDPLPPRKKIKTIHTSSNQTDNSDGVFSEVKMEKLRISKTKVFTVSGWSEDTVAKAVERLGGILSTSAQLDNSATHILAGKVSRSELMMRWIAAGKWVLHPDYVTSSMAAGHWLPEEEYEWGNPSNKFLDNSSTDEVKVARAAKKWRWCVANSGAEFTGAFSGFRVILHLPDEKKDLMKILVKYGGGSVLDVPPPYSVPSAASHCFSDQNYLQEFGKVDHVRLAARGIPVLQTGFLIDALIEPGPVNVEDYLLDDSKPLWMNKKASLSLAKMNAMRVTELRSRLTDLGLPVRGYKPDLVQRLFQHQGTVGNINEEKSNKGRNSWLTGNNKVVMGEVTEAIKFYTEALGAINNETCKNPSIIDIHTSRSEAFFLKKRYREALEDALFVMERNREDIKNVLRAIRCSLILGDTQVGKRCLSKIPHGVDHDQELKSFADKFKQLEELKERVSKHYEAKDFLFVLELVDEAIAISPAPHFVTMKAKCLFYQKKHVGVDLLKGIATEDVLNFARGLSMYCESSQDAAIHFFQKVTKVIPEATFWLDRANILKRAKLTNIDLNEYGLSGEELFNEATDFIPSTLNNRAASRMILGKYKIAMDDVKTVLSIVPNQTEATIKYVQCNLALGNLKEATAKLNHIIDPVIRNAYVEKLKKVEDQRILILDLMNQRLYNKAVGQLDLALKTYPYNLDLVLLKAECQAILVRIPQAENLLSQLNYNESKSNAHYMFVKGVCEYYQNKMNTAKNMFNEAKSIASKNRLQFKRVLTKATYYEQKAVAMIKVIENAEMQKKQGSKQKALAYYTSALGMDTRNKEYVLKVHLYRAEVYKDTGKYTAAIYDYDKAIEINPNCSEAWTGKGNVHMETKDFKAAVDDFEKAYNLCRTRENRVNLNKARRLLKNVGRQTHYNVLGISRNATNDEIKNAYYNKAKEFHPDKHMNAKEEERLKMEAMMKNVTAAQRCLSDPTQRGKYDSKLNREEHEDYNSGYGDRDSEDGDSDEEEECTGDFYCNCGDCGDCGGRGGGSRWNCWW